MAIEDLVNAIGLLLMVGVFRSEIEGELVGTSRGQARLVLGHHEVRL
jgi:hypothetical protein